MTEDILSIRFELYNKALKLWGKDSQIDLVAEECCELAVTILKRFRVVNGSTVGNIIYEAVDVEIMLEQLKNILNISSWDDIKRQKLKRLKELTESGL